MLDAHKRRHAAAVAASDPSVFEDEGPLPTPDANGNYPDVVQYKVRAGTRFRYPGEPKGGVVTLKEDLILDAKPSADNMIWAPLKPPGGLFQKPKKGEGSRPSGPPFLVIIHRRADYQALVAHGRI